MLGRTIAASARTAAALEMTRELREIAPVGLDRARREPALDRRVAQERVDRRVAISARPRRALASSDAHRREQIARSASIAPSSEIFRPSASFR